MSAIPSRPCRARTHRWRRRRNCAARSVSISRWSFSTAASSTRTLSGDLGISYRNQRPVTELIAERLPATLELVIVATFLSLALGIPLGVLCALKPNGVAARLVQAVSLVGISTPTFVTGIVLILVFAVSLGWLPSFGRGQVVDLGWWSTGFLTLERPEIAHPARHHARSLSAHPHHASGAGRDDRRAVDATTSASPKRADCRPATSISGLLCATR